MYSDESESQTSESVQGRTTRALARTLSPAGHITRNILEGSEETRKVGPPRRERQPGVIVPRSLSLAEKTSHEGSESESIPEWATTTYVCTCIASTLFRVAADGVAACILSDVRSILSVSLTEN